MTDFAEPGPWHLPPQMAGNPKPPGVVYAAAVVTWVAATGTAAMTLLLTVGLLLIAGPIFDSFDSGPDNPRWFVLGAAVVVAGLSAAADVVAVFMLRGHRWARWVLVGLCVVAALGGAMSAFYIVPLLVTAAALAVVVLLFLPDAGAWFRVARP